MHYLFRLIGYIINVVWIVLLCAAFFGGWPFYPFWIALGCAVPVGLLILATQPRSQSGRAVSQFTRAIRKNP